jgi:hypothetical protein
VTPSTSTEARTSAITASSASMRTGGAGALKMDLGIAFGAVMVCL